MKKILFVGSEAVPFAATGGLGDVLGSLPAALARADKSIDVRVVMPLYQTVAEKYKDKIDPTKHECLIPFRLEWDPTICADVIIDLPKWMVVEVTPEFNKK